MCIAPSPVQEDVIWVGTDDGNLQLTQDGGKTWLLVSKELTSGKKGKGNRKENFAHNLPGDGRIWADEGVARLFR